MSMTSLKASGYQQQLSAQLDEWRAELQKLKARAQKAEGEQKVKYARSVEDLEAYLEALEKGRRDLESATDDAMDDLKRQLERTRNDFKAALDQALAMFK